MIGYILPIEGGISKPGKSQSNTRLFSATEVCFSLFEFPTLEVPCLEFKKVVILK